MTNKLLTALIALLLPLGVVAQSSYFPPTTGTTWDSVSPASLGWCEDSIPQLLDFLDESNSKAFIVLKDGKIVIEHYFDNFTRDSTWYWASAGKSLTAFLVGLAQEQGDLDINDRTSDYLGQGWTSALTSKEDSITIWHQLTMTSGLDDGLGNRDCTLDTCLQYLADAGTRWSYHNAPYTLLDPVMENATGKNLNIYVNQQLHQKIGTSGIYLQVDYNNVFFSNPRSMARFGLLALNKGKWGQQVIMNDTAYFNAMTNTSQNLNLGYGYLWWLNGKPTYMVPTTQVQVNEYLLPNAPADVYAALGRDGQIINVVPSMDLVIIRMGESPGQVYLVPNQFNDDIWVNLLPVLNCTPTGINLTQQMPPVLYPNPTQGFVTVALPAGGNAQLTLFNLWGEAIYSQALSQTETQIDVSTLAKGLYLYQVAGNGTSHTGKLMIE